jgi:serine/threonine protein kinase
MENQSVVPPSIEELHAYILGKCQPERAAEIEAVLADGPDCTTILETAPEDALVRHLRGAGELPTLFGPHTSPAPGGASVGELVADAAPLLDHPRYRLIRKLGQGGMGTVYLAEHRLMRRLVAVKLIRAGLLGNQQLVDRFRQEVQAAAHLSHPHIVMAHDADEADGRHFLVMEYVEGESLAQRLATGGPFLVTDACTCVRQAALGLEFARARGLVHRDVKPHNLMRTPEGIVKILDFGLARVLRESARPEGSLTTEGVVMGTADYMAPEQARDSHRADIRADVYSLGCTLYHLLAGNVPFPDGTAIDKIIKHAVAQPEPLDRCRVDVPAELARVVEKMMARKAEDRYQTPAEVAAALEPFTHSGSQASSATVAPPLSRNLPDPAYSRGKLLALVLAALVLVCGAIITVAVSRTGTRGGEEVKPAAKTGTETKIATEDVPATPKPLKVLRRIPYPCLLSTAFSEDSRLCAASSSNSIRVWETETGKLVQDFTGFLKPLTIAFNPRGKQLLSSHVDGTFRYWDLTTGKLLHQIHAVPAWQQIMGFSSEGDLFGSSRAVLPREVQVWDLKTGKERFHVDSLLGKLSILVRAPISPDGKRLFTVDSLGSEGSHLRIFDVETGQRLLSKPTSLSPDTPAWSADSRRIYLNAGEKGASVIACLDADTGKPISRVTLEPPPVTSYGRWFSRDTRYFAVQYPDRSLIHLYDTGTGKLVGLANTPNGEFSLSFSPDGRYLACGGRGEVLFFHLPDETN